MTAYLSINFFKAFNFYRFRKRCARVGLKLRKTGASTSSAPLSVKRSTLMENGDLQDAFEEVCKSGTGIAQD